MYNNKGSKGAKPRWLTWRKYHKWVGVVFCVFMFVFCFSGIILNHRNVFSRYDVSRALLPAAYHIEGYNNGIVRGTLSVGDSVWVYGAGGIWLTDRDAKTWNSRNDGFAQGVDHRNVRAMVKRNDGQLLCVTNYDAYRFNGREWVRVAIPHGEERLTDATLSPDGNTVVVLSRSAIYILKKGGAVSRHVVKPTVGHTPKEMLFRWIWKLHSGELFGLPGKLMVDAIALVIMFLCVTGIVIFLLPYRIRRNVRQRAKEKNKPLARQLKWNVRWHNHIGGLTIVLTLFITVTGTCLRPPLMLPFVFMNTDAPGTSENAWNDRLRAIRWDSADGQWILSTSDGFLRLDSAMAEAPVLIAADKAPAVSPMGINVFRQIANDKWIVGSFSGMYWWSPSTGSVTDYFTGKAPDYGLSPYMPSRLVTGISADFHTKSPVVFSYDEPAEGLPAQPEALSEIPLSLWNVALELHVGRCYQPFLGPVSKMFIFIWGLLATFVLISGYILNKRRR